MSTKSGEAWFAAKTQGYGAGWPIAWQGWVVLATFLVAMLMAALLMKGVWQVTVILVSTALVMIISSRTTEGGWRWRGE